MLIIFFTVIVLPINKATKDLKLEKFGLSKTTTIISVVGAVLLTSAAYCVGVSQKNNVVQNEINRAAHTAQKTPINNGVLLTNTSDRFSVGCYGVGRTGTCIVSDKLTGGVVAAVSEDFGADSTHADSRNAITAKHLHRLQWIASHMGCDVYKAYVSNPSPMTLDFILDESAKNSCEVDYGFIQ